MCKQYTLVYECCHKNYYRQSSCNKRKNIKISQNELLVLCRGISCLRIHMTGECNLCQSHRAAEEIEFTVEAMKIGVVSAEADLRRDQPDDTDLWAQGEKSRTGDPEHWGHAQKSRLYRQIPAQLKTKPVQEAEPRKWQSRRRCKRTSSLLRNEVTPEEVIGLEMWPAAVEEQGCIASMMTTADQQKAWDATWDD